MEVQLSFEQALELLNKYVKKQNLIYHSLASYAVMKAIAKRLGENENKWALAGLLHDIDVEITNNNPLIHGIEGAKILKQAGVDEEIIDAIVRHNEMATDKKRITPLHHALAAGETITGLIIATTLVYPSKKIIDVKAKSILKRMKEKNFAATVDRNAILECEKINIPIQEFAEIALKAMQEIGHEIGL
ncbi:MAG TPA: HDIG domain-containing protein [Bacteroidales bacterium]|nr:HDIG domain-containing protein [Bacteroidales bacterium]